MSKKIILSFDYELFFGYKSGTVRKSLIEPTAKMLKAMEKVGAKATYFVDYLMIKYLEKANDKICNSDLKLIKEQLHDILRKGHRIELHIHPHWVDAIYNGDGTWNFDNFSHYMLTSFQSKKLTECLMRELTLSIKLQERLFLIIALSHSELADGHYLK